MKLALVTAAAVLLTSASVQANSQEASAEGEASEKPVAAKKMKKKKKAKITDRRHPDYIRCKSEPIIGSRAKRRRVCMTNSQWAAANHEGNRESRALVDDLQVGQNGGS